MCSLFLSLSLSLSCLLSFYFTSHSLTPSSFPPLYFGFIVSSLSCSPLYLSVSLVLPLSLSLSLFPFLSYSFLLNAIGLDANPPASTHELSIPNDVSRGQNLPETRRHLHFWYQLLKPKDTTKYLIFELGFWQMVVYNDYVSDAVFTSFV